MLKLQILITLVYTQFTCFNSFRKHPKHYHPKCNSSTWSIPSLPKRAHKLRWVSLLLMIGHYQYLINAQARCSCGTTYLHTSTSWCILAVCALNNVVIFITAQRESKTFRIFPAGGCESVNNNGRGNISQIGSMRTHKLCRSVKSDKKTRKSTCVTLVYHCGWRIVMGCMACKCPLTISNSVWHWQNECRLW